MVAAVLIASCGVRNFLLAFCLRLLTDFSEVAATCSGTDIDSSFTGCFDSGSFFGGVSASCVWSVSPRSIKMLVEAPLLSSVAY